MKKYYVINFFEKTFRPFLAIHHAQSHLFRQLAACPIRQPAAAAGGGVGRRLPRGGQQGSREGSRRFHLWRFQRWWCETAPALKPLGRVDGGGDGRRRDGATARRRDGATARRRDDASSPQESSRRSHRATSSFSDCARLGSERTRGFELRRSAQLAGVRLVLASTWFWPGSGACFFR